MRKNISLVTAMVALLTISAQAQITVPEPEFINKFYVLTGNDSYEALPKETGQMKEDKTTKAMRFVPLGSAVAMGISGVGMDIAFPGAHSQCVLNESGKEISIIVKRENNDTDPQDEFQIVRMKSYKKERRMKYVQVFEGLAKDEKKENGYVSFDGKKYGEQSYLLIIPAEEAVPGEYCIVNKSVLTATTFPVSTFSIEGAETDNKE